MRLIGPTRWERAKIYIRVTFLGFLPRFTPSPGFLPEYPQSPRLDVGYRFKNSSETRFEPATFRLTVVRPTTGFHGSQSPSCPIQSSGTSIFASLPSLPTDSMGLRSWQFLLPPSFSLPRKIEHFFPLIALERIRMNQHCSPPLPLSTRQTIGLRV
jgi:hypothetical protein